MIEKYFKKGEFDTSIIGHKIIGINLETVYPCGFNLIIRVKIGEVENRNCFFTYERENFDFLRPMELLGKEIRKVEYFTEGLEGGVKITVEDGFYIWLKQI